MIKAGLITPGEMVFDLDFHAIMHWGTDPALEKHYVPTRSQRSRSVLTFFAQDSGTHNLVYANADLAKATQNRAVIAFCDHWREVSGADPHLLVMDQKVTTQQVLGELDERGVKFLTLRMRSAALLRQIDELPATARKTVVLDRDSRFRRPRVAEQTNVTLSNYPGTVRQLIITGLGRDAPTVIITNDLDTSIKKLIERYARRMCIEQRLAEAIRAFHLDALACAVNLNIDPAHLFTCTPPVRHPRNHRRPLVGQPRTSLPVHLSIRGQTGVSKGCARIRVRAAPWGGPNAMPGPFPDPLPSKHARAGPTGRPRH
jgi:hypothetical protein